VRVASGAYYEKVVIVKKESTSLIGEDSESTIIDGQQKRDWVLKVNAENVTITGFSIRNSTREPYGGILAHYDARIYGNISAWPPRGPLGNAGNASDYRAV